MVNIFKRKRQEEVLCIDNDGVDLSIGEVYQILKKCVDWGVSAYGGKMEKQMKFYLIEDDNGHRQHFDINRFKPYYREINLDKLLNE